jgi:Icc-related predicted phosphoesterase
MKVTLISDTHTKHNQLNGDLPGGDLLINAGDFMNSGYHKTEAIEFFNWFDAIKNYDTKIFIAGNHDRIMQNEPEWVKSYLTNYKTIDYLQDEWMIVGDGDPHDVDVKTAKVYGSPWQPEFYSWAFNLPRSGDELKAKWDIIPTDTDILVTHGPAQTYLDTSGAPYNTPLLGCELLKEQIELIRPKIHVCGHIHGGYGYYYNGHTHFFNASVLNERYSYANLPFHFEWNPVTNEINWL